MLWFLNRAHLFDDHYQTTLLTIIIQDSMGDLCEIAIAESVRVCIGCVASPRGSVYHGCWSVASDSLSSSLFYFS